MTTPTPDPLAAAIVELLHLGDRLEAGGPIAGSGWAAMTPDWHAASERAWALLEWQDGRGWVIRQPARRQVAALAAAPTPAIDRTAPPDLYAAIQIVRVYLGIITPEQAVAAEQSRRSALDDTTPEAKG